MGVHEIPPEAIQIASRSGAGTGFKPIDISLSVVPETRNAGLLSLATL